MEFNNISSLWFGLKVSLPKTQSLCQDWDIHCLNEFVFCHGKLSYYIIYVVLKLFLLVMLLRCMFWKFFLQVAIITPFNFPLEIPVLQLMGALYMGNKPLLKVDSKVCECIPYGHWKSWISGFSSCFSATLLHLIFELAII